ncbi:response regulator [soil metagenome]
MRGPIATLVVEDEPEVAAIHGGWVAGLDGFRLIGMAGSCAEAVTAIRDHQPDLILLDIFLPDGSGLDLLRELRDARYGDRVGVIAITAAKEVDHVRAAMAGGVADYLVKPFSADLFRARLKDYAVRHHRLSARRDDAVVGGQREVDWMLGTQSRQDGRHLPKGLSARSMTRIVEELRKDDLTAAEAARRSGMSRVTARRYPGSSGRSGGRDRTAAVRGAGTPHPALPDGRTRRCRWRKRHPGLTNMTTMSPLCE